MFHLAARYVLSAAVVIGAAPALAKGVSQCKTLSCLDHLIPADRRSRFTEQDCAELDLLHTEGENLGFYCRLKIARSQASYRTRSPCTVRASGSNPDFDGKLNQVFLRTLYGALAWPTLPERVPAKLPESYSLNRGPFRSTSLFERQFRFKKDDGDSSEAEYQMFFCLAAAPKRYVPYYMALKIDGELRSQLSLVNPPMANEAILHQLASGFEPEYVKSFELIDLDDSGTKDILVLSDHVTEGYRVSACLHQPGSPSCRPIGPSKAINSERAASARLSVKTRGSVQLGLIDEMGREVGKVVFKIKGDKLEMTQKEGKF